MAIYEYECTTMGHTVEAIRPMADRDIPIKCEECAANSDPGAPTHMMTRIGFEGCNAKIKKPAVRTMRVWSVPFHRKVIATANWS